MKYTAIVKMSVEDMERVNRLLDINSIPELPDNIINELDVQTNAQELLFSAKFDNGVTMDFYLFSGMENYYTGPEFRFPDGSVLSPEECVGFSLSHLEEFLLGEDEYVVTIRSSKAYARWVVLAEDGSGKIHIFRRTTDKNDEFTRDVQLLSGLTVLAAYREKDVVEDRII